MATNPFDYAERFNPNRRHAPEQPPLDPVEAEIRRMRDEEVRSTFDLMPEPEKAARVTRLAREADVSPVLVEDSVEATERALQTRRFLEMAAGNSALARWSTQNPRGAAAAQDDTESLGFLGSAWDFLKNAPGRVIGEGGYRAGAGLRWATDRIADWGTVLNVPFAMVAQTYIDAADLPGRGSDPIQDARETIARRAAERERMRQIGQGYAERNRGSNWTLEQILSGGASVLPSLTGAGVAVATRNPGAGLSVAIEPVFGNEYDRARQQGLSSAQALAYAATQTEIEAITERLPVGFLAEMIAKRVPFGKALARQLFAENIGEQVATHSQDFVEWAMLPENSSKTFTDYMDTRGEAALSTVLATTGATTAQTAAATAVNRTIEASTRIGERVAQARQAREERRFWDRAVRAAEASKLRERDPEAFRELIRHQAEEAGATHVFIPGEAVQTFHQSDSYDEQNDPFDQDAFAEAVASGGDMIVPIEEVLTNLVGTKAWEAVKDDIRLTAGGMSAREAQSFEESMDDVMAELGDQAAAQDQAEAGQRTVREKIVDRVAEMFGVSFTSPAARNIAELFAQRVHTRAARLGQDITEGSLEGFEVRQVMPEGEAPEGRTLEQADAFGANDNDDGGDVLRGLVEFLTRPGPLSDQYQEGDRLALGERIFDVVSANESSLSVRFRDDGSERIIARTDPDVTVPDYRQFQQSAERGPRGRITFRQNERIIELFQSRTLATPLHELSHMWLEELRFDASLPDAPEQVKADWEQAKRYFAANGHSIGEDGQIPTEAHELWARSGERYFMEGKAPTSALVRLFETFRSWLVNIYKTVDRLRAPITPEIREVFDRLLATDEEIANVRERQGLEALFKDAASIGMSEPEFQAYQRQVDDARAGAHASLLDKTMRTIRQREMKRYSEARKTIKAEETERIDASPIYRALSLIKDSRVSKEWIVDDLGADALDLLPVRVPPLYVAGGTHPDTIAEQSGYASGREMIESIIGAERVHRAAKEGGDERSMRQRAIETATDEEFARRYGDPLNDGSIEREALAAVHSDMQGEVIASELRALSRKTGRRPTPYALAKEWARGKVRGGEVRHEASPSAIQRYARNAAKAGREAEAAMLKGDVDETFRQKQFQMMNNALVAEAKAAQDEVQAIVKRLANVAKNHKRDSIDQDYWEQAQGLLAGYDLVPRTEKLLREREGFERWAAARQAEGEEIQVPERLVASGTHYTRMTVEALAGLDDVVKSILHLGRRKKELQIGNERRVWEEARGEWLGGAENLPDRPTSADRNRKPSKVRGILSNLIRIDMMAKIMDGANPNGLMTRVLANGAKNSDNTYSRIHKEVLEPIIAAYMEMKGGRLFNRVTVPEWTDHLTGGPTTFLRSDLLAIALNLGNESNLRKMLAGEALLFKGQEHLAPTEAGIMAMLNRELNEAEWKMVELAWRRVNSMFPEAAATERELTGLTPEKIEPRTVETPYGPVEGGYWPVVYDSDPIRAAAAGVNLAEHRADDFEALLGSKGVSTNKGYTITRTDFVAPMFLNFEGVLFGHVNQVAKRIAYQAWAKNALKVIRDRKVKAMWARKLGEEYHAQLVPWLRDTINQGQLANMGHLAEVNGLLKAARMNLTVMGLVFRATTLIAQIGGLPNSMKAIGAANVARGFGLYAKDRGAMISRILEASPLMARRIGEFDRDQAAALAQMQRPRTSAVGRALKPLADKRDAWNAAGFHLIGAIQLYAVDLPTWAGAYDQAMRASEDGGLDMGHDEAVNYADRMVEEAQGAGRTAQLAAIQRAGEPSKILTMFYTFFGTVLNYQWEMTQDIRGGNYRKAAVSAGWIMVVSPLVAGLIGDAIRGDLPGGDDDDTWLAWMMRKVFFGMFSGIPIGRDFANQAERSAAGKYAPDPVTPWQRIGSGLSGGLKDAFAAASQTAAYRGAEDAMPFLPDPAEVSDKWVKHGIEALGFATGTGLGQVASTGQFAADVGSGDARPETAGDYVQGATTGRID